MIAGIGVALIPGLPRVELAPEVVLLAILPPLIYSAGVAMSWREFRFNLRPIALLAFGCVIFTTCAVAAAAHYVLNFDWAVGFLLGAIISPTDVAPPALRPGLGSGPGARRPRLAERLVGARPGVVEAVPGRDFGAPVDGGSGRPVPADLADVAGEFASPMLVRDRLVFLSDHEGTGNLYSCQLDGSGLLPYRPRRLLRPPGQHGRPPCGVPVRGGDLDTRPPRAGQRAAAGGDHPRLGRRGPALRGWCRPAGGGGSGRPVAAESENSGWVQQSLLLLHHSVRAGTEPERAGGAGSGAGAGTRGPYPRWSERHQPRAVGKGAGRLDRLAGLLRRLLAETPVERLRLSSVEPMDFSDDLLELMANEPRIARHVHAPLQSGCDRTLRRMHRKYRPRHYADRVLRARRLMPDAAIGADVMVGFPGESDADFEESRCFINELPFTYLHVFTYSERPGTPAAADKDVVPIPVRKERNRVLENWRQGKT